MPHQHCAVVVAFVLLLLLPDLAAGALASSVGIRPYRTQQPLHSSYYYDNDEDETTTMVANSVSDVEFEGPDLYGEYSSDCDWTLSCFFRWPDTLPISALCC